MTTHLRARHLRCHHCQSIAPIPEICPHCKSHELVFSGSGTERISIALQEKFPETPIFRIDRDTTSTRTSFSDLVTAIHLKESAILVGTQMLAKGHHFPNVTLVIVVESDSALMGTDFRSLERFGQQLTQVIGRAGRESKPGRALIQTHYPSHPSLTKLLLHGYHRFAMDLLAERRQCLLPPFTYQALIRLEDKNAYEAESRLKQLADQLRDTPCSITGPFPATLQRRAHYYRYQLLITSQNRNQLKQATEKVITLAEHLFQSGKQRWSLEIDPLDMN